MYSNSNLIYKSGDSTEFNNPNLKLAKTIKNKSLLIFTTKIMSYPCIIKFVFNRIKPPKQIIQCLRKTLQLNMVFTVIV